MVLPLDAWTKVAALLVSLTFAGVLWAASAGRPAHRYLAGFLLLIAANQGFEAVRSALRWGGQQLASQGDIYQLATAVAALDPLLLFYFASLYPMRNALNRTWAVGLVATATLALVATSPLAVGNTSTSAISNLRGTALVLVTAAVYVVVLAHLARPVMEGRGDPAQRLIVLAMAAASFPVVASLAYPLQALGPPRITPVTLLVGLPALLAASLGWAALRAPPRSADRAALAGSAALGLGLAVLLNVHNLLVAIDPALTTPGALPTTTVSAIASPVRWILFGALGSMALVRHDWLGLSLHHRRLAARGLVALGILGAAGLVLTIAATWGFEASLSPIEVVLLLGLAAASQGLRGAVDRVAQRIYGVPMPGDTAAAIEAYRAAVVEVRTDPAAAARLPRLQEELGLDARTAAVVERMAGDGASTGPLAPGALVAGRYRIERLLGRGGAGRVFRARDELLLRDVALKEISADGGGDPALLVREARLAGGLQHSHVVTVYDLVERGGAPLLVTELVEGPTLAERLREGALPRAEALAIADGILSALEAVHAKGVVHRDLKPANVLLAPGPVAKVVDFGIALARSGATVAMLPSDLVEGTPGAMAPEQRLGLRPGPAADLYAVGLLLRSMLGPSPPPAIEAVVLRALQEAPEDRWASAAEMRAALRGAAASPPGPGSPALDGSPAPA